VDTAEHLTIDTLSTREGLDAFRKEWSAFLETNARPHSVYVTPEYVIPWLARHGDTQPFVMVVREGGRIACVVPAYVHRTRFHLCCWVMTLARLRANMLKVVHDEIVLARDADVDACFRLVLETWRNSRGEFAFAALDGLEPGHPFVKCFEGPWSDTAGYRLLDAGTGEKLHRIRFSDSYDRYLGQFSHGRRNDFRRRHARLMAALGPEGKLLRLSAPDEVPALLDAVEQVFPKTWQSDVLGRYQRNNAAEIAAMTAMAHKGWLRGYVLTGKAGPVAFGIGYQYGDTYYFVEQGYDPAWASLAPGTVLNFLVVADMFATRTPRVLDFGCGDHQFKRVLGTETVQLVPVWIVSSLKWRVILGFQRSLARLEGAVRAWLCRAGLDERVRRELRGRRSTGGSATVAAPSLAESAGA
jgi:CelD/BcsL family acetyltransferase involved in cellulose biosynthesis